jgi:putative protease
VITGRELSIEEGSHMGKETGMEVEMFIHGAMCSAYSGQCTISNYTAGRDSNRGGCKQSCRFEYHVDGAEGTQTLMSSRDLNGLELIQKFVDLKLDSLKIEGRMKSSLYVASCCKAYREALEALERGDAIPQRCFDELNSFSHRGYTQASLCGGGASEDSIVSDSAPEALKFAWMGQVVKVENSRAWVQLKNPLKLGDALEVVTVRGENLILPTQSLKSFDGTELKAGKQESILLFEGVDGLGEGMMLRRAS